MFPQWVILLHLVCFVLSLGSRELLVALRCFSVLWFRIVLLVGEYTTHVLYISSGLFFPFRLSRNWYTLIRNFMVCLLVDRARTLSVSVSDIMLSFCFRIAWKLIQSCQWKFVSLDPKMRLLRRNLILRPWLKLWYGNPFSFTNHRLFADWFLLHERCFLRTLNISFQEFSLWCEISLYSSLYVYFHSLLAYVPLSHSLVAPIFVNYLVTSYP